MSNVIGSTIIQDESKIDFNANEKHQQTPDDTDADAETIMLNESAIRRINDGMDQGTDQVLPFNKEIANTDVENNSHKSSSDKKNTQMRKQQLQYDVK